VPVALLETDGVVAGGSSVDLPEPLGPITATISLSPTAMLAPRNAGVSPYDLCSSRPTRTGHMAHLLGKTCLHAGTPVVAA
jgi:hypothetical protein